MNYSNERHRQAVAVIEAIRTQPEGKRLGNIQIGVLKALIQHEVYSAGCGWVWDGHLGTVRVLETLVTRGLVAKTERPMVDYLGRPYIEGHPYFGRTTPVYRPSARVAAILTEAL